MTEIIKNTGEREDFDPSKLKESLVMAKTSSILADEIVSQIEDEIKDGMTTSEIYERAFNILNNKEKKSAAMYSIRRSVLELGPSGFPFEKYVAEIFKAKGYKVQNGAVLKGKCIEHEMDLLIYKDGNLYMSEIKFHNQLGVKSDTKTTLYIKARFDDLETENFKIEGIEMKTKRGLLITNTKFTNNAVKYAECVNKFDLISWDYPKKGNLYDLIYETSLQPATAINILSKKEKQLLAEKGVVTCKNLQEDPSKMKEVGIADDKIKEVLENIDVICSID